MSNCQGSGPTLSQESLERLIALCHHRWSLPILAEVAALSGAKFVTLASRLGLSRDSLSKTLRALVDQGWLMRNPGYGHPLRPEYVLTVEGGRVGPSCEALMKRLRSDRIEAVALRKWSLPLLFGVCQGRSRFTELKLLFPITPRALTGGLGSLEAARLLARHPASGRYGLSQAGRRLCPLLAALFERL